MRSYVYRVHPPDSPVYERCIGLSWCSECRIYTGTMVHVPREEVLSDALAASPPEQRERLLANERGLLDYLNSHTEDTP